MYEVQMRTKVEGLDCYCTLEFLDAKGKEHRMEVHELAGSGESRFSRDIRSVLIGLQRMRKPSHITVYTSAGYIKTGLEYMGKWADAGWKKANGKQVSNKELWEKVQKEARGHSLSVILEEGSNV